MGWDCPGQFGNREASCFIVWGFVTFAALSVQALSRVGLLFVSFIPPSMAAFFNTLRSALLQASPPSQCVQAECCNDTVNHSFKYVAQKETLFYLFDSPLRTALLLIWDEAAGKGDLSEGDVCCDVWFLRPEPFEVLRFLLSLASSLL